MLKNSIKTALRNIKNQPVFNTINCLGLVIAISSLVLISIWVKNELSFDKFHANYESIYRVIMNRGEYDAIPITPPPLAEKLKEGIPEIKYATRIQQCPQAIIKNKDLVFNEKDGIFADPDFFTIFSFKLIAGNTNNLFGNPFNIVVTEDFAYKYFNSKNVLNKTLEINGKNVTVSGIIKNVPQNSHLQFDFILPEKLYKLMGGNEDEWGNVNLMTYVEVEKGSNFKSLNTKVLNIETPRSETFYLQPLKEIHTDLNLMADNTKVTDKKYINIFIVIALIIVLLASVNYITIYISSSTKRIKEIGIRKISGSGRKSMIFQFISETALFILITLIISVFVIKLSLPLFNNIMQKELSINFFDSTFLPGMILIGIIFLLSIGIYPSLYFSSLKPVALLKKDSRLPGSPARLKKMMIFIQFIVTTILIASIITISKQLDYIKNKDLGFEKENIIYLPFNGIGEKYDILKTEMLKNPSVINVSAKNSLPVEIADITSEISWPGKRLDQNFLMEVTAVDYDYIKTLKMNLLMGRNFSSEIESDVLSVILNETAMKQMQFKNPIGEVINIWGQDVTVIGVVKDGLFYSLKEKAGPQIFYRTELVDEDEMANYGMLLINIKGNNIKNTLSEVKSVWNTVIPGVPFDFNFINNAINQRYWEEERLFSVIKYFVVLSIILSCLGLFGLSLFSSKQRVKEIGLRKVNGAKVTEILSLLNKDLITWAFSAYIIAIPLAYYILKNWLNNFAYKTNLSWWIFAAAGILALIIALFTTSWQSWMAARRNPVEALRYE